jgi:hypothetical protein
MTQSRYISLFGYAQKWKGMGAAAEVREGRTISLEIDTAKAWLSMAKSVSIGYIRLEM